ncbi:right-handed parallel beta-helix repeat-containing protein [Candidatus Micrarchaeota archaeon]|nr:right-handed parallel beta-helix repeat-containing protein [Candidatus Micrarchaeota archaeon]
MFRNNLAILFFVLIVSSASFAITHTCGIINESGEYTLNESLQGLGTPVSGFSIGDSCITIQTSNVTLDCDGFNISCEICLSDAIGIAVNGSASEPRTNITIRNCPGINNYDYGIALKYVYNSTIQNSTMLNSSASTDYGLHMENCSGVNVTNNTFYNNGNGIDMNYSYSNDVFNNTFFSNNNDVFMEECDYNDIIDNVFSLSDNGIYPYSSDHNFIANNTLSSMSSYAIDPEVSNYNRIIENIIHNAYVGISLYDQCYYNFIYNNTIEGSDEGIELYEYTNYNNVTQNVIEGGTYGVYGYLASGNRLVDNEIYENTDYGVYFEEACSNNTLLNNTVRNQTDENGVYMDAGSNGNNLTNNTMYGQDYSINIRHGRDNRIWGNHIWDSYIGVEFYFTNSSYIYENEINTTEESIEIDWGYNNSVENNTIRDSPCDGIYFNNANGTDILNNVISNSECEGIYISSFTSGIVIANNTVSGSDYDEICLYRVENIVIADNVAYNGRVSNIYLGRSNNITVINNTLYGGGAAFYLNESNYTITENEIRGPDGTRTEYNLLSAEDVMTIEAYSINWSGSPSSFPSGKASFEGKLLNITTVAGSPSIDTISWLWLDSESSGHDEDTFELWMYNGSDWSLLNDTPDTSSNMLTNYSLSPASIYGILEDSSSSGEAEGNDVDDYECMTSSDCDECYICSGHECVLPSGSCATASDCSGGYPFYNCEECSCAGYQCNVDSDCNGEGYSCENGACIPPECVENEDCKGLGLKYYCSPGYECVLGECYTSADCIAGSTCSNYVCIPPECTIDDNCGPGKMCENYKCVPGECRTNADCDEGFYCDNRVCQKDITPGGTGGSGGGSSGGSGGTGAAHVPPPGTEGENATQQMQQGFPFLEGDSSGAGILPDVVFSEETRISSGWIILFFLVLGGAVYFLHNKRKARVEKE